MRSGRRSGDGRGDQGTGHSTAARRGISRHSRFRVGSVIESHFRRGVIAGRAPRSGRGSYTQLGVHGLVSRNRRGRVRQSITFAGRYRVGLVPGRDTGEGNAQETRNRTPKTRLMCLGNPNGRQTAPRVYSRRVGPELQPASGATQPNPGLGEVCRRPISRPRLRIGLSPGVV